MGTIQLPLFTIMGKKAFLFTIGTVVDRNRRAHSHSGAGYQASFGSVRLCLDEVAKVVRASGARAVKAKL